MNHHFHITFDVAAAPERVWAVMSDVERWHEWTASITKITRLDSGPLRPGCRARIRQPRLAPALWTVTALEPNRSFTWETGNAVVRAVGHHAIEPTATGSRVTLSVAFSGLFAGLVAWFTRDLNDRYLKLEAEGLKRRSEEG